MPPRAARRAANLSRVDDNSIKTLSSSEESDESLPGCPQQCAAVLIGGRRPSLRRLAIHAVVGRRRLLDMRIFRGLADVQPRHRHRLLLLSVLRSMYFRSNRSAAFRAAPAPTCSRPCPPCRAGSGGASRRTFLTATGLPIATSSGASSSPRKLGLLAVLVLDARSVLGPSGLARLACRLPFLGAARRPQAVLQQWEDARGHLVAGSGSAYLRQGPPPWPTARALKAKAGAAEAKGRDSPSTVGVRCRRRP